MAVFIPVYLLVTAASCIGAGDVQVMMNIFPSGNVVKYVNEDLNLTCRVNSNAALRYQVTWSLPINLKNGNKSRVSIHRQPNEVTVTIYRLQEIDSGKYYCEVSGNDIQYRQNLRVTVKPNILEKLKCSDRTFRCGVGGYCIPRRYICDGFVDCPDGKDEFLETCGSDDPCKDKVRCDDGRCVSPAVCCDPATDPNCVSVYIVPCCLKLTLLAPAEASPHPQYGDIGFIQSTIYTIVSCAVAFIFITLIMIVAICRIHMKRTVMSMHPDRRGVSGGETNRLRLPWDCLRRTHGTSRRHLRRARVVARWSSAAGDETASNESLYQSAWTYPCGVSSTGSFVVTYDGTDGVRLMERLPKPPPYTETATSCSAMGPPPPYSSVEDLNRPRCSPPPDCPAYRTLSS